MLRRVLLVLGLLVAVAAVALITQSAWVDGVWFDLTHRIEKPESKHARVPLDKANLPLVRLAAAGDVGTGGDEEWTTAESMDLVEDDLEFDALLLLGDNVYEDGDPAELQRTVFDPFAGVLDGGTQLLAVLGNHDTRKGHRDAHATAIGMPAHWYATTIDDVLVISLDSNRPNEPDQLAWLERTLNSSDASWTIATMHHPPYSGGHHGSDIAVRQAFTPLFEQFGVQLVLAGHDHDYQRSEAIEGVTYVVSGAAAKLRATGRADFTAVAWSTYHFLEIAVWEDRIDVRAIDQAGDVFDEFTLAA